MNPLAPSSPRRLSMTLLLLVGLATFVLWAAWFDIDQTVRAQGLIINTARTQVIQSADGGVLSKILVQEGQQVVAGQLLAQLEKERPSSAYEENRAKVGALMVALQRARAEGMGVTPDFSRQQQDFPDFVAAQQALYLQRKRGLQEELATVREGLGMAQEELRMNEALLRTGDSSRLEVMRAQRQVTELQGKTNTARNKYQQDARQEESKLVEELSSTRYKLEERVSILGHTEMTAPVAGIVKYLKVTTIGGVLRAGDELMQISPTDGERLVEIKVNPVDIGQLKPGLPVTIRVDAFDYSIYGNLHGTLSLISSDTLTDQGSNGQSITYYRAQVRIDADNRNPKMAGVALKPGMTATVDIRTTTRSVLHYLLKPIFKSFDGALHEN
jgi:adhesin transport system membrane fusion protein